MKKAWMVIIIIASVIAFAGMGFVVFKKVKPSVLNKQIASGGADPNGSIKRLSRKAKPISKIINLRYQTPTQSSSELLDEFSSLDVDGRIKYIASLYTYEPSLLTLALSDKSKDVRIAAIRFISYIPEDQVDIAPFMSIGLDDELLEVREEARNTMDYIVDVNTMLKIMRGSIDSRYADTRLKCVSEAAKLGVSKEDLKELTLKALADEDRNVQDTALKTASFLWGKEFKSEQEAIEYISSH